MKIIIEQLDGRHKGYGRWTHRAEFRREWAPGINTKVETTKSFIETRNTLWETFGPGCDREELYNIVRSTETTPEWGWWTDPKGGTPYIYFKRGQILTWFLMRS